MEDVLADAVRRRVFPGAVAEAGGPGSPWWRLAVGHLSYDAAVPPTTADTIYDLAYLTKVVCTTTLVMRAVDRGNLDLDAPVSTLLATWRGPERETATLRDLLAHAAGLPAWIPLYERLSGRSAFERAIAAAPLAYPPGDRSVYSDLGFVLLGFILEDLAQAPLPAQFDSFAGTWDDADILTFSVPPDAIDRTAPTREDTWRGRLLRGEVDDSNAYALGGAAGHAGMFGTARALGSFARRLLRGLDGDGRAMGISREALALFARRAGIHGSSRALGWDTMLPTSSCGAHLSPSAFGHTGFTGTSLWIDPERQLYAVLLSNRVHPTPGDPADILAVRQAFHDAI